MAGQTRALATRNDEIEAVLVEQQDRLTHLLAKNLNTQRFIRVCVGAMRRTPKLRQCSVQSLVESMLASGTVGLEPNTPTGEAFLIPRAGECQFQIGYQGFITLAARNSIVVLRADKVCVNDEYEIEGGTDAKLVHKVRIGDRGEPLFYYVVIQLPNGARTFDYMDMAELGKVEAFALNSRRNPDESFWRKWPNAARSKTVIRKALKLAPGKGEELSWGIRLDSMHEGGTPDISLAEEAGITLPQEKAGRIPLTITKPPTGGDEGEKDDDDPARQ